MTQMPPREIARRLLLGGERLAMAVDQPPGGGGTKFEPQTALEARDLLLPLVQSMMSSAAQLPPEMRGDRIIIEAQLLPNYLAPSHYPSSLLSEVGAVTVGSRAATDIYRTKSREKETVTRRMILAVEDDGLQRLQGLIESPPTRIKSLVDAFNEIRKLDDIGVAGPDRVVVARADDDEVPIVWEAVLHPVGVAEGAPIAADDRLVDKWFALVESFGGTAHRDYVRRLGGLTFAPITLRGAESREVARFNPLRAIRPMPPIRPAPAIIAFRRVTRVVAPASTTPVLPTPSVAVFDGGVDNAATPSALFPAANRDLTPEAPDPDALMHGTGVVGAAMYGLVAPNEQLPTPALPVVSHRMFPMPTTGGLDEYWFLDQIRDTLTNATEDFRIVNLSLGPERAVEESAEPDRWTSELDHLASEMDVLFVVAAGNNGDKDRTTGLHRVQVPGDMVNGLAVGACDLPPPDSPWTRTNYSAMGPGRHGNRVQPSGLQFGGHPGRPFQVLGRDGDLEGSAGTSFAAPVVTHALADLATRLPAPTANALRAFAVHFAERKSRGHRTDESGHARFPVSFEPFLDCDPDEAHVLFEDEIDRGELHGYRVPLPSGVSGPIHLRMTLAYASPIEATQPTEYTRVSLDVAFRPHSFMHRFSPPRGSGGAARLFDLRDAEAAQLVAAGWKMSQEPVTKSVGAGRHTPEVDLRDAGKWETVRTHRVTLQAGEWHDPRIEIAHLARRGGHLLNTSEPIAFALLMTVQDRSGEGHLYDDVTSRFPTLRPVSRATARVRVRRRR
jgi:hypothetical protein